jgi:hypothetical protein
MGCKEVCHHNANILIDKTAVKTADVSVAWK